MRAQIEEWWQRLTRREQIGVAVAIALSAVVVLYVGMVRPLMMVEASARARLADETHRHIRIADMLARLEHAPKSGAEKISLRNAITTTAKQSNVKIARLESDAENRLTISVSQTTAEALFDMLARLASAHHIAPDQLRLEKTGQGGALAARIRFAR